MGKEVVLGTDYSVKPPRKDKAEYYGEVDSGEDVKSNILCVSYHPESASEELLCNFIVEFYKVIMTFTNEHICLCKNNCFLFVFVKANIITKKFNITF